MPTNTKKEYHQFNTDMETYQLAIKYGGLISPKWRAYTKWWMKRVKKGDIEDAFNTSKNPYEFGIKLKELPETYEENNSERTK